MKSYSLVIAILALTVGGCTQRPAQPEQTAAVDPVAAAGLTGLTGRDWVLVSFGEHGNPSGTAGQPLTLRLDSAETRASGFSGCNRFTGTYALAGDSLSFGRLASTRMACPDAGEVEQSFLNTLAAITSFSVSDATLTLNGPDGPLARFRTH